MEKRAYSDEEVARRGDALYEKRVRPNVDEQAERGKFVAIDVASEDYEVGADELDAIDGLERRRPAAQVWLTRIGLGYAAKIGGRPHNPEPS